MALAMRGSKEMPMDELYERIKKRRRKAAIKRFMQSLVKLIPLFGVLIFILTMVVLSENKMTL